MYINRHGLIFYFCNLLQSTQLENVDYRSFEALSDSFAKDNTNVYYDGHKIEGADPKSFSVLNTQMAKDANNVFLQGHIFKFYNPVDIKTLRHIGGDFFRDQLRVYCIWYTYDCYEDFIIDADPETLEVMDSWFARDKNKVFNHGEVEENLCAKSVQIINNYFVKDRDNVYFLHYGGKETDQVTLIALDADPVSFRILNDLYARDDRHVFFYYNCRSVARSDYLLIECLLIETEDPDEFRVFTINYDIGAYMPDAYDGVNLYYHGRKLPLARHEFKVVDQGGQLSELLYADMDKVHSFICNNSQNLFPEGWFRNDNGEKILPEYTTFGAVQLPAAAPISLVNRSKQSGSSSSDSTSEEDDDTPF